jgi:hypothetical protein
VGIPVINIKIFRIFMRLFNCQNIKNIYFLLFIINSIEKFELGYKNGSKKPLKITLSGILRWIFGLFFLVIASGMVTERE